MVKVHALRWQNRLSLKEIAVWDIFIAVGLCIRLGLFILFRRKTFCCASWIFSQNARYVGIQLTRIDEVDNISVVRKINKKARIFFEKLKDSVLYEIRPTKYNVAKYGRFYLNYNEFGVKKRCYSNLRTLKIGLAENKFLKTNP